MFGNSINYSAGPTSEFLDGILDSVCCDLDATISASYVGSGQTWANLVSSPADGAGQTDYDFFLGADENVSTDDPTFTGSAGDPAAYFNLDGADFFKIKSIANAIAMKTAQNSNTKFTFGWGMRIPAGKFTRQNALGSTAGSIKGIGGKIGSNDFIQLAHGTGTSGTSAPFPATGYSPGNTNFLTIISYDTALTTDNVRYWIKSITKSERSFTFNAATGSAASFAIAALPAGTSAYENTTRLYNFFCLNDFIDDTEAALIIDHFETRHSRDYTP